MEINLWRGVFKYPIEICVQYRRWSPFAACPEKEIRFGA
jgi:hypothetical protein